MLRYEMPGPAGTPTRWFEIDLLPLEGDLFGVVVTYGIKDPKGVEDGILQPMTVIFKGAYQDAEQMLIAKAQNREKIGYTKIEPKPEAV